MPRLVKRTKYVIVVKVVAFDVNCLVLLYLNNAKQIFNKTVLNFCLMMSWHGLTVIKSYNVCFQILNPYLPQQKKAKSRKGQSKPLTPKSPLTLPDQDAGDLVTVTEENKVIFYT